MKRQEETGEIAGGAFRRQRGGGEDDAVRDEALRIGRERENYAMGYLRMYVSICIYHVCCSRREQPAASATQISDPRDCSNQLAGIHEFPVTSVT